MSQYGGPADSLTWSYDVGTERWTDLSAVNGPGNRWVGAMDSDPEHHAVLLLPPHPDGLDLPPQGGGRR